MGVGPEGRIGCVITEDAESAGEFHPEPLTEPDVNLSIHPAPRRWPILFLGTKAIAQAGTPPPTPLGPLPKRKFGVALAAMSCERPVRGTGIQSGSTT
jgi:hypothetical protein